MAREQYLLMAQRGRSHTVINDNEIELTSIAILRLRQHGGSSGTHSPGKPTQNAFVKSFNGHLRNELLNELLLTSLRTLGQAGSMEGR